MPASRHSALFKVLLASHGTVDAAIADAAARIASIGRRNDSRSFRSVKRHGASITKLYDQFDAAQAPPFRTVIAARGPVATF